MSLSKNSILIGITSILLFLSLFYVGIKISSLRGLWNDEIFTQRHSIQARSYLDIIQGKAPEGNNFPLFYFIQKFITQYLRANLTEDWEGKVYGNHESAQIILRIQSNLCISLALSFLFYFFTTYFSYFWGLYSVLLFLSAEAIWVYWAEARPYGLWIFLTCMQCIVLFRIYQMKTIPNKWWVILGVCQTLLTLTAVFAVIQAIIGAVSIVILKKVNLRILFYQLTHLMILSVYYYARALHFETWFNINPIEVFYSAISKDMLLTFVLYIGTFIFVSFYCFKNKQKYMPSFDHVHFVSFATAVFIFGLSLLGFFILKDKGGPNGFTITPRHFIFLLPPVFMGFILCMIDFFKLFKNNFWMRLNVFFVLIFVFVHGIISNSFVCYSLINLYLNF